MGERGQTTFQAADADVGSAMPPKSKKRHFERSCGRDCSALCFSQKINMLFFDGIPAAAVGHEAGKELGIVSYATVHTCLARARRASAIHSLLRLPQSDFNCGALLSPRRRVAASPATSEGRATDNAETTSVHTQCDMELIFYKHVRDSAS